MQVAQVMHEELQRLRPCGLASPLNGIAPLLLHRADVRRQHARHVLYRTKDIRAALPHPPMRARERTRVGRVVVARVDVVQRGGVAVLGLALDPVRPAGDGGEVAGDACCSGRGRGVEDVAEDGEDVGVEVQLSDRRDHLVSRCSPREGRVWQGHESEGCNHKLDTHRAGFVEGM